MLDMLFQGGSVINLRYNIPKHLLISEHLPVIDDPLFYVKQFRSQLPAEVVRDVRLVPLLEVDLSGL